MNSLRETQERFSRLKGKVEAMQTQQRLLDQQVRSLTSEGEALDMVVAVFRSLMDAEIHDSVKAIDALQSEGLRAVFPDQVNSVHSELEVKRGKVGISMITRRDYGNGQVVDGESDKAFGGAVATVQSVLLRIFVTLKRGMRPILLMDETLAAIEGEYVLNMARFLSTLSKRFGFDILLVTHDPRLVDATDVAYRISVNNGEAVFKKVR